MAPEPEPIPDMVADTAVDDAWHQIIEAQTIAGIDIALANWQAALAEEQASTDTQS